MNKRRLIWIYFLFNLLFSCKNDEIPASDVSGNMKDQSFTVNDAKEWFQSSVILKGQRDLRINGASNKEAVWQYAISRNADGVGQTIIVPIRYR